MAIVKTKAGTYRVDFRDQSGRRLRKTFDTLKAAREYDRISKGDISKRDFVAPLNTTVADACNAWYQRKFDAGGYRYGSLHDWRIHIDRHIISALGSLKIQQVTVADVEKAAAHWGKAVSVKSSNKILMTLSAIFKNSQRCGLVTSNVAALAERLKVSTEDNATGEVAPSEIYGEAELRKLIDATEPGSLERLLVMVPALTGMRVGEVLGLTWSAIDFKAGVLNVRSNLVVSDKVHGVELKAPKSKKSRRTLDMPRELAHELRLWKLKCPPSENDLVFATPIGGFTHRWRAGQIFNRVIEKANVKRRTFHALRHGFASLLLSKGVDIAETSRLLGHGDCAITLKIYSHFVPRQTTTMQDLASSILS